MNQKSKLALRIFVFFMVFVMAIVPLISTIAGVFVDNHDHTESETDTGHETTEASTTIVIPVDDVSETTEETDKTDAD